MVTGQQCLALIIVALFVGVMVGMFIWFLFGTPRCEHKWEKIIDDKSAAGPGHVVVHMCTKCGKRKFTNTKI
jgi:membrane protein DedA with SNARE-associated domain